MFRTADQDVYLVDDKPETQLGASALELFSYGSPALHTAEEVGHAKSSLALLRLEQGRAVLEGGRVDLLVAGVVAGIGLPGPLVVRRLGLLEELVRNRGRRVLRLLAPAKGFNAPVNRNIFKLKYFGLSE